MFKKAQRKEVENMVEINVEYRKRRNHARRIIEELGQGPDKSGPLTLKDGTVLDINLWRVHPYYDGTWQNRLAGRDQWPIKISVVSTPEVGPTQSPYLQKLADTVRDKDIQLGNDGSVSIRLTDTRMLIVKLDHSIWTMGNLGRVVERYYPEYPELSGKPEANG